MFRRLFNWLKRPKVMVTLGILLLMGVIYFVGPNLLGLKPEQNRNVTLLIGGLAFLVAIVFWIKGWLQERKLGKELKDQSREQASRAETADKQEIAQLEKEFQRAFDELARIRPGTNIFKGGTTDSLPWITIIGPPGAGKSTILQASGLRFTSLGRRVRGIGGTRSCVWWLAEEAIFIDTAGRYSTIDEDHDEWIGFLKLLQRSRKDRPLDAAVLQVSIDEIIHQTPQEIEEMAQGLRERLDEQILHLRLRFPVFLVFNKLDRLEGFAEFFGGLLKGEAGEPWGFGVDANALGNAPLGPLFEERFEELVEALQARATARAFQVTSREHREAILAFPQEFARHIETLRTFAEILFEPSRHRERPWLAAVHFVSAMQEGRTLPGIRHKLLEEHGAPPPPPEQPMRGENAYFVSGLFANLVKQARDAARPSDQALRNMRISRAAVVAAMAPLCFALSWFFSDSYLLDSRWISEVVRASEKLWTSEGAGGSVEKTDRAYLYSELSRQADVENLLMYRESGGLITRVYERAAELLRRRVDDEWLVPMTKPLERRLDAGAGWHPGPDSDERMFSDGFLALKAEYVLAQQRCPGVDAEETSQWMGQYLSGVWGTELGERRADVLAGSAALDLQDRVTYFFDGDLRSRVRLDERARDSAIRALKGETSSGQGKFSNEVVFNLIVANTDLTSLEPQMETKLIEDPGLKRVFTLEGCEKFLSSSNAGKEWWACLLDIKNPPQIDRDKTYLEKFVDARYKWLTELKFKLPINDVSSGAIALGHLEHPQTSELDQVLEVIGTEAMPKKSRRKSQRRIPDTNIPGIGRLLGCFRQFQREVDKNADILPLNLPQVCKQARAKFEVFGQAISEDEQSQGMPIRSSYVAYKDGIRQLKERLQRIERATTRNADALGLVLETTRSEGPFYQTTKGREDFFNQLESGIPQVNPRALNALMSEVEFSIWRALLPLAARALQEEWRIKIYEKFQDVKYKANRDKENEVGACNRVLKFLNEDLEPFIADRMAVFYAGGSLRACTLNEFMGSKMPIISSACLALDGAVKVARTLACEDGGSGDPGAPGLPGTVEAFGTECPAPLEWVEIDTGAAIYNCAISSGRCSEVSTRKTSGKAKFVAKRKGSGDRGLTYLEDGSYEGLLKRGSWTRGAVEKVRFKINTDNCRELGATIFLVGGTAPSGGKKVDTSYRTVWLPDKIAEVKP